MQDGVIFQWERMRTKRGVRNTQCPIHHNNSFHFVGNI